MITRKHPSGRLLERYASGELPPAPSITLAAHLESCAECEAHVRGLEEAHGDLLTSLPPASLGADALERLMARIDAGEGEEPTGRVTRAELDDVRLPNAVIEAGLGPRRWLAFGLWAAPVISPRRDDWRTFLLRAPAKTHIPSHGHPRGELMNVLFGVLHDGETLAAGDFAENRAGSEHALRVGDDGPCACLISLQGRPQWRGLSRLITPILGI